ncbi:MAG: hypothetical protein CFH01_00470 [Alphaproteobacteria bacterium MarineAlpha2_Bin1]|nr:MAG: hypothetical protein CFH01_00470 [Alphaproteobacteria bacterium MarineAlpha2_Bin1]
MSLLKVEEDAKRAFEVLIKGGIGILPMDVGYSLIGGSIKSLKEIFSTKKRSKSKLNAMLGNTNLHRELHKVSQRGSEIIDAICNEYDLPLGVIAPCNNEHPLFNSINKEVYSLSTLNDTLLMLMNAGRFHKEITELSYKEGHLLFGSSANISLTGTKFCIEDMQPEILEIADIIIDYGLMKYNLYGQSSTLLNVETLEVFRVGVCYENIADILHKHFAIKLPIRK